MKIVATGSIAYDYLMFFPGKFTDYLIDGQLHQVSVSFLVDSMTKHWGGVAANIAYTLGLLGIQPQLLATVGRDFSEYRTHLEAVGVDTSTVQQIDSVFTASFFCNTDENNNQIASFYTGAMAFAKDYSLTDVLDELPNFVIISPNDPTAMSNLAEECRENDIRFIYDPSQQVPRLSGEELRRDMQGAYALIVNAYEAEMICKKTGYTMDDLRRIIEIVVITEGPKGSHIYLNGDVLHVDAFPTDSIKDPTGGGDAYRAGLIYGLAHKWPLQLAGQVGALCATYVLENLGTQSHKFTRQEFVNRFRTQYDDNGLLDVMLESAVAD